MIVNSLSTLPQFLMYFLGGLCILISGIFMYTMITPTKEIEQIRQGNLAPALSLSGAIMGMAIAIYSAAAHTVSPVDFIIWGIVAVVSQLLGWVICYLFLGKSIIFTNENQCTASGVLLGGISIGIGLINAGAMVY